MSTNPLIKHFRQPAIHVRLPSNGNHWPIGDLVLPETGELPVFPMTTKDEITLKTPDALLNGSGIVQVMESCCPAIKRAWSAPSIDVDSILIAIRIASYGHGMDIESKCPHCKEDNTYEIDLRTILSEIVGPDFSKPLEIDGLKFYFKPQSYLNSNKGSMVSFTEQKIINTINDASIDEQAKAELVTIQMRKIIDLSNEMLAGCTKMIELEDGTKVAEPEFITEYYQNAPSKITRAVQNAMQELLKSVAIKPRHVACNECKKEFDIALEFDYANFFAVGF